MWPQLLALIPHITRLIPAVDRYLQSRTASERAQEETLTSMSDALRKDLTQINTAHGSLTTQLQNQEQQLITIAEDLRRIRASYESAQIRADAMELQLAKLNQHLKIAAIAILVLLLVIIAFVA